MAKGDELELDTKTAKTGSKSRLIILIAVVMLVTTGALIATLYFTGSLSGLTGSDAAEKKDEADNTKKTAKEAFYYNLQPAFIVNFEDQSSAAYLQIEMQSMTHDKEVNDLLTKHMPVIRNNILLIMSAQKFDQVKTRTGKEKLQAEILEGVRKIVGDAVKQEYKAKNIKVENEKNLPNVEQIYFTSFIMQ